MDWQGNYIPVPEEPQEETPKEEKPAVRLFQVGDKVKLVGRVLEVQHSQGTQYSVKVQLPNGAVWLQDQHLELG